MKTDDAHGPNQLPRGATQEELVQRILSGLDVSQEGVDAARFEAIAGHRELIDGAQMKVRPVWMQKLRRDIRKAWADSAGQDDDGES